MDTALWVVAGGLATAYLIGGLTFLLMPKERYRALAGASGHWVDDFSDGQMKVMGTIKVTGALGLVLPALVGVAPVLVPLAATGLMLYMAGAGTTRFRRSEWTFLVGDLGFLLLFAFVAWGRFVAQPLA
ncbi:DoxX family protein [Cellulomonas wangsupingiae]|uniref:DoxX family protein n=1 Tax=Cellulomonas wangsupingiae TaxID=2968085 RepID=A0ABY5K3N6_9CELL|nr:DoxX family protein [Cellulomonas wangsupingiae]MCC2333825.1 DoxX family protein [Cellulomonas wangsupingiae]UUI65086.1 DoxX family protein [Cellulomonas wangsupingiae]